MASDGHAVECLLEETDAPQTPRRLPQAEVDPYFIWNGEVACEECFSMRFVALSRVVSSRIVSYCAVS